MSDGIEPFSWRWGLDRGRPFHRYYIDRFLTQHRNDIRGTVLEFQDPEYVPRLSPDRNVQLEILHLDHSNPVATIVGDLTKATTLPPGHFDCIVCTHVLHHIGDLAAAVDGLYRMLRPGGVLLAAVPAVSMDGVDNHELWRFTTAGLNWILCRSFRQTNVTVQSFGNSLTAAAEIRGLTTEEFSAQEIDHCDPHFAVEVCARAVRV